MRKVSVEPSLAIYGPFYRGYKVRGATNQKEQKR